MTNSYEVDHGLSQDAPGPPEPVEIAQQPGAAPATGNTARDQEMYAAGIRTGEENAKHNAAIRAGVPAGYKLVPIEPTPKMIDATWDHSVDRDGGIESQNTRNRRIYAAMLAAAPAAPGVSTVEDVQPALTRDRIEEIAREVYKVERFTKDDEVWHNLHWLTTFAKAIEKELRPAPAAGDARPADCDAAFEAVRKRLCALPRYSFFIGPKPFGGVQRVEDRSGKWIEFDAAHELFDPVCVDAAIAAQRKGDA